MGYMHIENLYRYPDIMLEPRVIVQEKIHGTSAHIQRTLEGELKFFSGGEKHDNFVALFQEDQFDNLLPGFTIFGEAYGGKQQKMSATYGPNLKFIAFDLKGPSLWAPFEETLETVRVCGLEFVAWSEVDCTLENLNTHRDAPSIQAARNGILEPKMREGIVIRPLVEKVDRFKNRLIAKHKNDAFRETKTPRVVGGDPMVFANALEVAREWVTEERLSHVLDKLVPTATELSDIPRVCAAMCEDIFREGSGEVEDIKENRKAISTATVLLYKRRVCNANPRA